MSLPAVIPGAEDAGVLNVNGDAEVVVVVPNPPNPEGADVVTVDAGVPNPANPPVVPVEVVVVAPKAPNPPNPVPVVREGVVPKPEKPPAEVVAVEPNVKVILVTMVK